MAPASSTRTGQRLRQWANGYVMDDGSVYDHQLRRTVKANVRG